MEQLACLTISLSTFVYSICIYCKHKKQEIIESAYWIENADPS